MGADFGATTGLRSGDLLPVDGDPLICATFVTHVCPSIVCAVFVRACVRVCVRKCLSACVSEVEDKKADSRQHLPEALAVPSLHTAAKYLLAPQGV